MQFLPRVPFKEHLLALLAPVRHPCGLTSALSGGKVPFRISRHKNPRLNCSQKVSCLAPDPLCFSKLQIMVIIIATVRTSKQLTFDSLHPDQNACRFVLEKYSSCLRNHWSLKMLAGDSSYFFYSPPAVESTQQIRDWAVGRFGICKFQFKCCRDILFQCWCRPDLEVRLCTQPGPENEWIRKGDGAAVFPACRSHLGGSLTHRRLYASRSRAKALRQNDQLLKSNYIVKRYSLQHPSTNIRIHEERNRV